MKIEVAVMGSPSLIVLNNCGFYGLQAKHELELECSVSASELGSCVKVEVAIPDSRPLTVLRYGLCGRKEFLSLNLSNEGKGSAILFW